VIDLLGPFELWIEGRLVSLAPRLRTLTALLAVAPGVFITAEDLIDELWRGEAIDTAAKTLQGYIARLRKLIGAHTIISRFGSYALNSDVRVISARFETRASDFLSAQTDSNPRAVVVAAQQLEALWRGRPLDGVPTTTRLDAAARRLTERQTRVATRRIQAQMASDPRSGISELEALLVSDPVNEELWELLIRSLHLANRRNDALAAATRARRILATELGLQPGAALQAAERSALTDGEERKQAVISEGSPPTEFTSIPTQSGFIGRHRELKAIIELADACSTGKTFAFVVQGPAGIGKTALLWQTSAVIEARGGVVLVGRSDATVKREYGAASDILEQVRSLVQDSMLDAELFARCERVRCLGRSAIAELTAQPPSTAPRFERKLVARAVALRIREAAAGRLLNVVFEDVHWADTGTLDVIQELITGVSSEQVLVSIAHRTDNRTAAFGAVLHDWERTGNFRRLSLLPFALPELTELVSAVAGADYSSSAVIQEIMTKTDGNALLATEMASTLRHGSSLPEGVRDLVEARLSGCSSHAVSFAEFASLIGRRFDLALVTRVVSNTLELPQDYQSVIPIEELVRAGIIELPDAEQGAFRHELLGDAISARIGPSARIHSHRAILETLETADSEDLDALVFHSVAATSAPQAALRLAQRARRSLVSGHIVEAIADATAALHWHQRCVDTKPRAEAELRLILADAYDLSGNFEAADAVSFELLRWIEQIDLHDAHLTKVAALRRLARTKLKQRDSGAWVELTEAVDLIGFDPPTDLHLRNEWIEVWLAVVNAEYFFGTTTLPWAQGALDRIRSTVEAVGTARQQAGLKFREVQLGLGNSNFMPTPEQARDFRSIFAIAQRIGDLDLLAESAFGVGFVHLCRLEGREAWVSFDDAADRYHESGDAMWRAMALLYGAMARRLAGDVNQTCQRLEIAQPLVRSTLAPAYQCVLDGCLLWVAVRQNSMRGENISLVEESQRMQLVGKVDQRLSSIPLYPFSGFFLWPMLSVLESTREHEKIQQYVRLLLDTRTQPVPSEVRGLLESVASEPDSPLLSQALRWARTKNLA
jgi:DNA-binding SARP family transcriptional activator